MNLFSNFQRKEGIFMEQPRRDFLFRLSYGGACMLCAGAVTAFLTGCDAEDNPSPVSSVPVTDSPVIDLNIETTLQSVGGAVKKRFASLNSGRTIVIVRVSAQEFIALAAQCTHQGTEVNLPSGNIMVCPNHGSKFNASTGSVVQGPAGAPLPSFSATYDPEKNTVTIG
jgi:cytochrome b6-f complex iron-sulfur subunit